MNAKMELDPTWKDAVEFIVCLFSVELFSFDFKWNGWNELKTFLPLLFTAPGKHDIKSIFEKTRSINEMDAEATH